MEDIVIVAAARTAVGKFGGSLAKTPATELGSIVIQGLLARSGLPVDAIGEVIMGQVLAAGVGQNPARQAMMKAGVAKETPALTINAVCGSGLKAVMLAAQAVAWGDSEIVIAGGQENMSASPHVLNGSRDGQRMGDWKMTDTMIVDGLWDVYNQYHMGITAENVAKAHGITRDMQDALAAGSQRKAAAAQDAGKFKDEIVDVLIPQRKGDALVFNTDEFINKKTTVEVLAGLRPAFDKAGSVTAGNASGINDGAAAVMVMSAKKSRRFGPQALGPHCCFWHQRSGPGHHGYGPRACVAKGAGPRGLESPGRRPVRTQRSLCRTSLCRQPGARHRSGQGQRQRRCDRDWSPHRCIRLPHSGDLVARNAAHTSQQRLGRAVHWWGHGRVPGHRARLTQNRRSSSAGRSTVQLYKGSRSSGLGWFSTISTHS